jgi:predicted NUDIX family NTP pyrophosphohydrolase
MARQSAGILLFRVPPSGEPEVFLVHPGGPLWARKDDGAWSIPKGGFRDDEEPPAAALREFEEETGVRPSGEMIPLQPLRQPDGKQIHAWASEGDLDPAQLRSNLFSLEWPPRSGKRAQFPEVDRGEWFSLEDARRKILKGQAGFLDQLRALPRLRRGPP